MYLVNAFTDKAYNGNATGVVVSDSRMTSEEMQNIARDLNQSETVFISRLDVGIYKTRFFTPEKELDLCGHATIATFYSICENEYIAPIDDGIKKITQHAKYCKIPVELEYESSKIKNVYMNLQIEEMGLNTSLDKLLKALNLSREKLGFGDHELLPKKISSGISDILIPVKDVETLSKIKPDYKLMKEISKDENIISFQVFTLEGENKVRQRTFSPSIGINEEAGSGTSTGATLFYLKEEKLINSNSIISTQGIELNRKSVLTAEILGNGKIRVGGKAYVYMNGVLNV